MWIPRFRLELWQDMPNIHSVLTSSACSWWSLLPILLGSLWEAWSCGLLVILMKRTIYFTLQSQYFAQTTQVNGEHSNLTRHSFAMALKTCFKFSWLKWSAPSCTWMYVAVWGTTRELTRLLLVSDWQWHFSQWLQQHLEFQVDASIPHGDLSSKSFRRLSLRNTTTPSMVDQDKNSQWVWTLVGSTYLAHLLVAS